MTRREICERLMEIRDYANLARGGGIALQMLDDMVEQIAADIKHLLLDLAAPKEEEHFADAGKMVREEKEPPVLLYEENGEKVQCPAWESCTACGEPAYPILNKPGTYLCKKCGVSFRLKRREEGR